MNAVHALLPDKITQYSSQHRQGAALSVTHIAFGALQIAVKTVFRSAAVHSLSSALAFCMVRLFSKQVMRAWSSQLGSYSIMWQLRAINICVICTACSIDLFFRFVSENS